MRTNDIDDPTGDFPTALPARLYLVAEDANRPSEASGLLDGAWWPRTRDLAVEVPLLVDEFALQQTRVSRFAYHPQHWQLAPTRVHVAGRTVHLGWFRDVDPNQANLSTALDQRITLLVIPPETDLEVAARACEAAVLPGNRRSPTEVLADAAALYLVERS